MELVPMLVGLCGFLIIFLIAFMLRSKWPVHKHYPALESRLRDAPHLLGYDGGDQAIAQNDEARAAYSLTFDHINNLGFMTYIMHVTVHDRTLLPDGVTCDPFDPWPRTHQNNTDTTYTHSDVLALGHRISVPRKALVAMMFSTLHAPHITMLAKPAVFRPRLREFHYDAQEHAARYTFYLKAGHFEFARGSSHEERLARATEVLGALLARCVEFEPKHDSPAAQWIELMGLADSSGAGRTIFTHILTHFDREQAVSRLCQSVLEKGTYIQLYEMFRHDSARFFGAISPERLLTFVRAYTCDAEGEISGYPALTPERFQDVFGAYVPFSVIEDRKVPMPYRVELVRRWLKDAELRRDALHAAIAGMHERDQMQLRAALESDSSLSGALSSTDTQAGKLTLDTSSS